MIKNVRIYKNDSNRRNNFKISKIGLGTVAIVSSLVLFLSGCGFSNNAKTDDYFYVPSSSIESEYDDYDILNDPLVSTDMNDYSNSNMKVTEASYDEFINYINHINTKYNYESYYNIDEAMNKYNAIINKKVTKHSHTLSNISVDALFKSVKSNNSKFLKEKKEEYTAEFYEEFSDSDLRRYCTIIVEMVNHYIDKGLVEDINEVKCILGDLKIFNRPTMTNAYITDDNCLMISPSMIETLKIKVLDEDQDLEKSTIGHETMHILQKGCSDNNKLAYSIGNSYKFDDLKVNPLFYNWFYEGAAEKLINNATNYKPLVYEYYINYINSLSLSTVLNEKNYVNQPEETTLSNSLTPLFDMFGCTKEEEKKEIIKMMFSLDIIETDTEDFINAVNPNMDESQLIEIKRNLKSSVCETLSKYFYKNLAILVKNKNIPLNDIFYYITIFEADVESHISYGETDKYNDSINFIETYLDIQRNFFKYLESSEKYSQEEIENMFDTYGLKNQKGNQNFSLSYLNQNKKKFLTKMLNSVYNGQFEQIQDVYNRNTAKNKTK